MSHIDDTRDTSEADDRDDERELIRGSTPTLVLAVLSEGPRHGYAIAREVNRRTEGALKFKQGTLYPVLHGLERDGLVAGAWSTRRASARAKSTRSPKRGRPSWRGGQRYGTDSRGRSAGSWEATGAMSSRPDGSHAGDDAAAARAERQVEEYLDRLCEPLAAAGVPAPERSELRQEAAAHIAWLVEEFLQQGRSPLEATREALEEFGPDPVRVGRAMAGGWLRRRRRLPRWGGDISPRSAATARPELVLLFRGLAAGLRAGLALADALAAASRQVRNARLRSALSDVAQQVSRGRRLSEAMGRHPGWFPELHRALAEAGERSDTLATALLRAADDLEREQEIRSQLRGAFAYPLGLSLIGLATVLFLLCYVVPVFDKVYRQFRAPLPPPTWMLVLASELFTGIGGSRRSPRESGRWRSASCAGRNGGDACSMG
jgi:hypothetical protein